MVHNFAQLTPICSTGIILDSNKFHQGPEQNCQNFLDTVLDPGEYGKRANTPEVIRVLSPL